MRPSRDNPEDGKGGSTQQLSTAQWDLLTGRVGDPPGLDTSLGSSQALQVEPLISQVPNLDEMFPLMSPEELDWVDRISSTQSPEPTLSSSARDPMEEDGEASRLPSMPPPAPRATEVRPVAPHGPLQWVSHHQDLDQGQCPPGWTQNLQICLRIPAAAS